MASSITQDAMEATPAADSVSDSVSDSGADSGAGADAAARAVPACPRPRAIGAINWVGLRTLTEKEIQRFIKVGMQTVFAPMVTSLLFFAVFSLALGGVVRQSGGVPFLEFLAPGLIMMGMIQNAFANTSSSVVIGKVQGNIVDVLMPPLSHFELALGWVAGGVARGLVVGLSTWIVLVWFAGLGVHNVALVFYHAIMGSMLLALIGIIGGIWADKFDHIAAVQNFAVMPLTFLSGTFYSVERLPEEWRFIADANPIFYIIDGFRYGFIGHSDGTVWLGVGVVALCNIALWILCLRMLASGYKLKS